MSKLHDLKDLIRELADLIDQSSVSEIEIEDDDIRIRVARAAPSVAEAITVPVAPPPPAPALSDAAGATAEPAAAPDAGTNYDSHPGVVKSPMVGTAYAAPEPSAPDFIKEGSSIAEGDTLLIVEAMKVMNPIPAPKSGTVKKILFNNGEPVEYGQPLVIVE